MDFKSHDCCNNECLHEVFILIVVFDGKIFRTRVKFVPIQRIKRSAGPVLFRVGTRKR